MINDKIKIAFITPLMIIGGAETYIINKCEWLINNGFDVIVISEGGENVANLPAGVDHTIVKGVSLPPTVFSRKLYQIFLKELETVLVDNKVDVIEANNSYPAVHSAAIYKNIKIPFFINILSDVTYRRNPLLKILTINIDQFGLYYILTSDMNEYIQNFINYKLHPNIIPIPVKAIPNVDNKDGKYILSVSRLSNEKDYVRHLMKDFFNLFQEDIFFCDYKLFIVGDGLLREELSLLASNLNKKANKEIIQLKGTLVGQDLLDIYKKCSVFVGMGTTLLLAASCAKPCIIAGFSPETKQFSWGFWGESELDYNIIGIGSANGRSHYSFSNSISRVLKSDIYKLNLGQVAYKMFSENYDNDSIMRQWSAAYYKVIDIYKSKGNEIEKKLKYYDLWFVLYRQVRTVVKLFKF